MYMLSLGLYEYERVTVVVVVGYKCTHRLESYIVNLPFANTVERYKSVNQEKKALIVTQFGQPTKDPSSA